MSNEIRIVMAMAAMRLIAGSLEVTAALFMLRIGKIDAAMRINAGLGLVGPAVFIAINALGLVGLATGNLPLAKIGLVFFGVLLIFLGTR